MRGAQDNIQQQESWLSRSSKGHFKFHFADPDSVQLLSEDDTTHSD
jgi:hypothetical protein